PGLRAAVAAALLSVSPEAAAQTPPPSEQISPEQEFVNSLRAALKKSEESIAAHRRGIGDDTIFAATMAKLKETSTVIADPRYGAGIKLLQNEYGAKFDEIVGILRPSTVMDESQLRASLARIPENLKGHFSITVQDVERGNDQ